MRQSSVLPSTHTDLITDAAYDYFGRRLATSGADQKIKVWRRQGDGSWEIEEEWKAHDAPIAKIAWSHPEHGPLLASCSYDRSVRIWEENTDEPRNSGRRWKSVAKLMEARGSVRDLAFGPSELGLRLATISSDSHLRLYQPNLPSLSDWYPLLQPHIPSLTSPSASSSSSAPLSSSAVSGSGSGAGAGPSSQGSLARMLGTATDKGADAAAGNGAGFEVNGGGRCLSFCKEKWWGMAVAVGEGVEGEVKIISLNHPNSPQLLLSLVPPSSPSTPSDASAGSRTITSLSWAPSSGRSYHLVATGSREGLVRIWKVWPPDAESPDAPRENGWTAQVVATLGDHARCVTRVEWNSTGTVLSSSGDDGKVRMWKAPFSNDWQCLATFDAQDSDRASNVANGDMEE